MNRPALNKRKGIVKELCLELRQLQRTKGNTDKNDSVTVNAYLKNKQRIYTWLTLEMLRYGVRVINRQSSENVSSYDKPTQSPAPSPTTEVLYALQNDPQSALQNDAFKRTKPTKFENLSMKYSIIEATNWAARKFSELKNSVNRVKRGQYDQILHDASKKYNIPFDKLSKQVILGDFKKSKSCSYQEWMFVTTSSFGAILRVYAY